LGFEFWERFYTLIKLQNVFLIVKIFIFTSVFFQIENVAGQMAQPALPDSIIRAQNLSQDHWLGKDKLDHAMTSAGLVAAQFYLYHQELDWKASKSRQIAAGSTLMIGIAKEIYDQTSRRGTPSWKDLLADLVGIGVAVILVIQ
jgi:uncharacterized protein YfiM (DUF2279 family)